MYIILHCIQCGRKLAGEGLRQYERGPKHLVPHYLCPFCGHYPLKHQEKKSAISASA